MGDQSLVVGDQNSDISDRSLTARAANAWTSAREPLGPKLSPRSKFYSGLLGEILTPLGGLGSGIQLTAGLAALPWYHDQLLGVSLFVLMLGACLKQTSR